MTHPFLALNKLITGMIAMLAHLLTPRLKPAAVSDAGISHSLVAYLLVEGDGAAADQPAWFIYGRVRHSAQRIIIEWQTRRATTGGNFAIYRGRTLTWREARLLDLSIFATAEGQPTLTTYRAVDTTAAPPGPYYYWIVDLTAKQGERRYGPYSSTLDVGER